MSPARLSVDELPAWAVLNSIDLAHVRVQDIEGKGCGLVACHDVLDGRTAVGDDGDAGIYGAESVSILRPLLRLPRDCVLTAETVEECAKVNQNFRQLLDSTSYQTTRAKIMLFLLTQIVLDKRGHSAPRGAPLTPWTEYVKFLPVHVPLPTMWSANERQWLVGTSLESALEAKVSVLVDDFFELRKRSSDLQFWYAFFWEDESATLEDWVLADALYRSRCLELPHSGEAMVPVVDMANHSHSPVAYYDEDANGDVVLSISRGHQVMIGQEITISYGSQKSAAEMLFSYGFVDQHAHRSLTLPLDTLPGDSLGLSKLRALSGPPMVKLWHDGQDFKWDSPSAYLLCLNEEDGLDFRVLQHTSGERELRTFWHEEDVTDQTESFESLIGDHPLSQVFKLRVVMTLLETVTAQSARLEWSAMDLANDNNDGVNNEDDMDGRNKDRDIGGTDMDESDQAIKVEVGSTSCIQAAETLRRVETDVLKGASIVLEEEKAALLRDENVLAYLESMQNVQHETIDGSNTAAPSEEDDFS